MVCRCSPIVVRVCSCGHIVVRVCSCNPIAVSVCSCGPIAVRVCSCGPIVVSVSSCGPIVVRVCSCGPIAVSVCSCGHVVVIMDFVTMSITNVRTAVVWKCERCNTGVSFSKTPVMDSINTPQSNTQGVLTRSSAHRTPGPSAAE